MKDRHQTARPVLALIAAYVLVPVGQRSFGQGPDQLAPPPRIHLTPASAPVKALC